MSEVAVIVNGPPGAGKTTLCSGLAPALGMPVVAKDAIKEALAEVVPVGLPTRRLGAVASDTLWSLVALIEGPAIVESFWARGRDDEFFRAGVAAAGIRRGVEVWCEAPMGVLRSRFVGRARHFAHRDAERLDEWEGLAAAAAPISGFPLLRVDTSAPVDVGRLAEEIRRILGLSTAPTG